MGQGFRVVCVRQCVIEREREVLCVCERERVRETEVVSE